LGEPQRRSVSDRINTMRKWLITAALADFQNSIGTYPTGAELATVNVPVLCTYGTRSPNSMVRLVRSLAAAIRTARAREIQGAGNAAPVDATTNFVQLVAHTISAEVRG
jgi:pimeloyl-ACP methyl ester carboxylesterase